MESVGRRAAVVLVLAVCTIPSWSGIASAASSSTTVALAVTPPSWIPGTTSVSMVASMTPATVGGTVAFYDGKTLLGTVSHRAIRAFLGQVELSPGRHALSATFRPDDASFDRSSTSVVYQFGVQTSQPTITDYQISAAVEGVRKGRKRKAPPGANGLRVRVPQTRVLGVRTTRATDNNGGSLSGTGVPLITLTMVGLIGVITGIVVRSGIHRRRRAGS